MKYQCFASGSKGNMHVLTSNTGEKLVLDMGLSFAEIKKNLNYELSDTYFIVSHLHSDHFKGYAEAEKKGCMVYFSLDIENCYEFGEFSVVAFDVKHNVPTQGFYIYHPEMGVMVYITDSSYIDTIFAHVNHWLIEANHDEDIIIDNVIDGDADAYLGQRVLDDHLSIQACKKILRNQDLSMAKTIVLVHLSDGNSHERRFKREIIELTGVETHIARPGLKLDLSLNEFEL